jgi:hypothetical protein
VGVVLGERASIARKGLIGAWCLVEAGEPLAVGITGKKQQPHKRGLRKPGARCPLSVTLPAPLACLGEAAHAEQAVHGAAALVAVHCSSTAGGMAGNISMNHC